MNSLRKRALDAGIAAAVNDGLGAGAARIAQLILLVRLSVSKETYTFDFSQAAQQKIAPDFGLGLLEKDAFLAHAAKLQLLGVPIVDGKEAFTAATPVNWADPTIFAGAAADANSLAESQQVNSIFAARMEIKTNNDIRQEDFPTQDFRRVYTTQGSGTTVNEQHHCEYEELGSLLSLNGFERNTATLTINCVDKSQMGGTATRANYAMLTFDGVIIKSATTAIFTRK